LGGKIPGATESTTGGTGKLRTRKPGNGYSRGNSNLAPRCRTGTDARPGDAVRERRLTEAGVRAAASGVALAACTAGA
jgi:hypothetical protein